MKRLAIQMVARGLTRGLPSGWPVGAVAPAGAPAFPDSNPSLLAEQALKSYPFQGFPHDTKCIYVYLHLGYIKTWRADPRQVSLHGTEERGISRA